MDKNTTPQHNDLGEFARPFDRESLLENGGTARR